VPQSETLHPRLTSNLVRVGAAIQHNPKGTVKRMLIFLRILTLAALSVASTLSALAQNPDTDLPAVPNQATLRTMRGNSLSQDPLYGGYWGSGCCFCPAQPVSSAPAVAPPASSTTSAAGQTAAAAAKTTSTVLPCGTLVRLAFVSQVSSKTAQVGDPITLRVTQDIKQGDAFVVPKGALADGTITFVHHPGPGGIPGLLAFELNGLQISGNTVPLWRAEGRSGEPKPPGPAALIPVAGMFTMFMHGKEAQIKPGTPVTAFVAADTTLPLQ